MTLATSILVWVLVIPGWSHRPTVQLGPYIDLASCERVQKSLGTGSNARVGACVQVNMPKGTT